jgi:hypothetical protein
MRNESPQKCGCSSEKPLFLIRVRIEAAVFFFVPFIYTTDDIKQIFYTEEKIDEFQKV